MDNYKPIALLSNFSKILEKIIYLCLSSFLNTHNLLSASQFGFCQGHSTVHPTIHFLDFITKAFNKNHHVISIFCDLRKAFDTVDHNILFKKLEGLGVRGLALQWFKNYLSDRKQFVFLDGKSSLLKSILLGVPQGSILGPLLFLVYINDLPEASLLRFLLFADDTTILASGPDIRELYDRVNFEFHKVAHYFRRNKLALHPKKTNFILFTNSADARNFNGQIYINNNDLLANNPTLLNPIVRVTGSSDLPAVKFLGVYFNPLLNFKHHVSTISSKISSSLYFLRSAKNILSYKALKSVYYSLVHCHLIYCIHVWSCCSQGSLNSLFKKTKKCNKNHSQFSL